MANFCIFRTAKLKTDGNVSASISHALRARETPNADTTIENWTNLNQKGEDGKSHVPENAFDIAMARYRKTLPKKIGKGRVPCVELMMTVSPEVMARKDFNYIDYLNDCDNWARDTFGKDNVFFVAHHKDESTPHTSIFLVPKVTKKYRDGHEEEILAAKQWLGGREKLSKLQDDFYENVGKKYGLERGVKNSRATHEEQRAYYSRIKKFDKELSELSKDIAENMPKQEILEKTDAYKKRVLDYMQKQMNKIKPYFTELATARQTEKRYKNLQKSLSLFQEDFEKNVSAEVEKRIEDERKKAVEPVQIKLDEINKKLHTETTTVNYKDGIDIKCEGGILSGLRERADIAYAFKSLTACGFKDLAERMEKMNLKSGEDAYLKAKEKGMDIGEWLDTPIQKKSRGYGGMSMS